MVSKQYIEQPNRLRFFVALLMLFILSGAVYAQIGKIDGVVVDSETGEPVVGASVLVVGTTMGAAAGGDGYFSIINIRPGSYTLRISAVGYTSQTIEEVRVVTALTTDLGTIQLSPAVIGLEEVTIIAERPVVDRTRTSTRTTVTSDEIAALPVIDVAQLVGNTASSFDGFVRGGRLFETKTVVDGVDVSDAFYAAYLDQEGRDHGYAFSHRQEQSEPTTMSVNVRAIEELSVNTGSTEADYASASAGVVAMSLREGRGDFFGSISIQRMPDGYSHFGPDLYHDQDRYFEERQTKIANNAPEAKLYNWTPDKYSYGKKPDTDVSFSLGGTVLNNLHLFSSGRYYETYGRYPGEFQRRVDLTVRPTFDLGTDKKVTVLGILEDRGQIFGWKNRRYADVWRFFLEGVPVTDGFSSVASIKYQHVLSPQTFYEIQVSHTHHSSRQGYVDQTGDGQVRWGEWDGDFIRFENPSVIEKYVSNTNNDPAREKFFAYGFSDAFARVGFAQASFGAEYRLGRPIPYFEDVQTGKIQLRGDVTSQVTRNHQIRAGFQVGLNNVDFNRITGSEEGVIIPDNADIKPFIFSEWSVKPKEYSLYIQDRMEYADLVINLGLRLDGFDRDAGELLDFFHPYERVEGDDGVVRFVARRGDKLPIEWYLSPRLGISHPITDRAAMYFSFSQSTQLQPYAGLYNFFDGYNANTRWHTISHVSQDPIRSINYEMGVQVEVLDGLGLDINAYYRDIQNNSTRILNIEAAEDPMPQGYSIRTSWGYADARGIEFTLTQRPRQVASFLRLSGRVSYTYSYIKEAVYAGGNRTSFNPSIDETLPFNELNTWNTYEQNVIARNSVLTGGYDRPHRVTFAGVLGFPADFQIALFGRVASGFYYPLTLEDPRSRALGVGPSITRFDARIDKGFKFSGVGVRLFADIQNIFDNKNIMTYDNSGVQGGQRLWEEEGDPTGPDGRVVTGDGSSIYDFPRFMRIGLQIEF